MEVWRNGDGWGLGGSPCLLSNKRVIHRLKPPAGGGESWAPSGQAAPPPLTSLLFRTALLCVMVPLERSVSRFFNAKWAKRRRFLPIQWIDFLLWSVQGPIINVYLLLMAVYKTVHIIPGLMNVHASNCQFVYVGYASSRNCVWALSVCVLKEHWSVECFLTAGIYKLSVHLPSIMPISAI